MTRNTSKLKKTLQNLFLACLNATLILVFLCLLTAYFAFKKVEGISIAFAQNLVSISPLVDEVSAFNTTMIDLKEEVELLRQSPGANRGASSYQLEARLDKIQASIDDFNESVRKISNAPTKLIDHAIDKAALELKTGINEIRSCSPPTSTEPLSGTVSN